MSETNGANHPFRRMRKAGVPLVAYESGDLDATIKGAMRALNGSMGGPSFEWDCLRGLRACNDAARAAAEERNIMLGPDATAMLAPGVLAPMLAPNPICKPEGGESESAYREREPYMLPARSILWVHNAQRFLDDVQTVQGLANLRNAAKAIGATIVLLGPGFTLPAEIKDDTILIEEASPTGDDISRIVTSTCDDVKRDVPEFPMPELPPVVDTLLGYRSEFQVEQSLALSVSRTGVDTAKLWDLKVAAFRKFAGLEISLPDKGFDYLAGTEGAKTIFRLALAGKLRPRAVLQMDEIEKMVAGSGGGDLSGVSSGLLEQFLFWTEERKVQGVLLVGVPGAGKSATCRAVAGEGKVPLLRASMSTVKGSLVGQSEQQMKQLLRAVDAVSQGQCLMIATCNSLDALAPELMARFKLATFVYDFPDEGERAALWDLYQRVYSLPDQERPQSKNWVGREIESCCQRAWMFDCPLVVAAQSIVPIAIANRVKMDALRQSLSGRFLSAAHPGPYEYRPAEAQFAQTPETTGKRKLNL